jgi:Ca2+-binding EF-hand superfamily protein
MKTILLLIPLFALSVPAFAQNTPATSTSTPAPTPRHYGVARERFMEADTNHDGMISREEAQAMPFVAKHFDEFDTNHDGYITREEMRAGRERMLAARGQRSGNQRGNTPSSPNAADDGMN